MMSQVPAISAEHRRRGVQPPDPVGTTQSKSDLPQRVLGGMWVQPRCRPSGMWPKVIPADRAAVVRAWAAGRPGGGADQSQPPPGIPPCGTPAATRYLLGE